MALFTCHDVVKPRIAVQRTADFLAAMVQAGIGVSHTAATDLRTSRRAEFLLDTAAE